MKTPRLWRKTPELSALLLLGALFSPLGLHADNSTWSNAGAVSGNWSETSNWAALAVPGATSGTTNADTATFNTALGTYGTSGSPVVIDSGRNIKYLTFSGAAGAYTIGTTGGNTLLLSADGVIQRDTLTTGSNLITINAPLQLQGNYGIYNNNGDSGGFRIGGAIAGTATAGNVQTLTLNGWSSASTNNVISGAITDGVNGGSVRVNLYGPSTWALSGTSVITGGVGMSSAGANGILRNTGNLTAGGTAYATTFRIGNGTFDNQGQLTLTGLVSMDNNASIFLNSGTIAQSGGNRTIYLNEGSSFTNSGVITVNGITVGDWGNDGGATNTAAFTNNSGGNITVTNLSVGPWKYGTFTNAGGNVTIASLLQIGKGANDRTAAPGTDTLTLTSGTVTVNAGATLKLGGYGTATDTAGVLNLNGGTLATAVGVTGPSGNATNTGTFNFNGGTLRGTGAGVTLLGTGLTAVNVKSGGATVEIGAGLSNTISANLLDGTGGGGLTKTGTGNLTLTGANTYTGTTTASAGTLLLSGSGTVGTGNLVVASGATFSITNITGSTYSLGASQTLSGSGTVEAIGKTLSVAGGFNPGSSPGTLTVNGGFTLTGTSNSTFEINGTTPGLFDSLVVNGALTFGGTLNLSTGYAFSYGDNVDLFDWTTKSGTFSAINGTDLGGGNSWDTSNLYTSGVITVVPEPSTWALLAVSLAALVIFRRRRRVV